jgi:predicted small lipoprotein YifL
MLRRAVGLILVLITLSACGNKGSLYLPTPEQNPEQNKNSKPAPRQ